jgi:hypothetical protein
LIIGINTFTVLLLGGVLLLVYLMASIYQKRFHEVNLEEIGAVFFATTSLCGGTKLMYTTLLLLDPGTIESDQIYTAYGGFCVVWVSVRKLKEKINSGQKKSKRKI